VIRTPPPVAEAAPPPTVLKAEADNDVLGALVAGVLSPLAEPQSADFDLDVATPPGMSSALNALLGKPDTDLPSPPPSVVMSMPAAEPTLPPVAPPVVAAASPPPVEPPPPPVEPPPPPPERPRFPTPPPRALPRRATVMGDPAALPTPAPVATRTTPPHIARPAPRPAGRPAAAQPFAPQVSPSGRHERPAWETPAQGSPRPGRLVGTTPAPPRRNPADGFAAPVAARSQADIAVELTAALTSRMKPPPKPRRDLNLSTALWLLATGIGAGLLLVTLFTPRDLGVYALLVGAAEVVAGYVWIVWLAARRDWVRGVLAAVPPLTAWYLGQWKYARFRPLRFALSGVVVAGLALVAGAAQPYTRAWVGITPPAPEAPAEPEVTTQPKVAQLRHYRENRNYAALAKLLRELSQSDAVYSAEAKDRADLRAETKALCDHPDAEVKVEALAAFSTWGGDTEALERCLTAVRTDNPEARLMALKLLPKWKTERVAGAVVARMQQRPGMEATAAQDALTKIGGPVAERAAVPLLGDQYDQNVRLAAVDVLADERVASPSAAAALRDAARASGDPAVRAAATAAAARVEARLNNKK
jgi:multisubunit Na+/H+ antiporter MnhB subunit